MSVLKRSAIALAALCLLLTACRGEEPVSSVAPSSSSSEEPSLYVTADSETLSAAAGDIASGIYGDNLIRDCKLGEGVVPPDAGRGAYDYRLPELLSDTTAAQEINKEIGETIGGAVEFCLNAIEAGETPPWRRIYWSSGWNGSVVSLLIQGEADASFTDCSSYHYDFATGRRLTDEQLAAHCGYTADEARDAMRRAAVQKIDEAFLETSDLNTYDGSYPFARTNAVAGIWDEDELLLYLDETGALCSPVPLLGFDREEWYYEKLRLCFPQENDLPEAREDFIAARLTDGVITVTVDDTADARNYLPDADLTKEYVAEGFWGDYHTLYIGTIGQDFYPYLFAMRTDGGVEFADLFSGIKAGRICSAGLIPGARETKWIESGSVTDDYGGYWTQFIHTESGDVIDAAEAVDLVGWDLDEHIRGSWYGEVEHPVATGNSYTSAYSLDIAGDGSLRLSDLVPDVGISVESTGGITYIGSTRSAMLFNYSLTDEEGAGRSGVFSLQAYPDQLYLQNVAGTALFDEAVDGVLLQRAYG